MSFPTTRLRRLRSSASLRNAVRETDIAPRHLVYPLFVVPGQNERQPIAAMPGCERLSVDLLPEAARHIAKQGVSGAMLFGVPSRKDTTGAVAADPNGLVPRAIDAIKQAVPELLVWTDVCLCAYLEHGHCGVLRDQRIDNDATQPRLADLSLTFARAGADIIAPSVMMDGRIAAIRARLDAEGFADLPLVSYAAKYASAFYGPFREAAGSAPAFGDRRTYQMDPANAREALREVAEDIAEGADMVLIKPALSYLDIIRRVADRCDVPVVAYNVSGEYSMLMAAAQNGWLDADNAAREMLTSIRRAGADIVISYFAKDAQRLFPGE